MIIIFTDWNSTTNTGTIRYSLPGTNTLTALTVPTDISATGKRPVFAFYKNRLYINNAFSRPLVLNEYLQVHENGINAPANKPTITATGGTAGNGYITFAHKYGEKLIHESNLSIISESSDCGDVSRVWGNLPTSAPDQRVTHIRGYLSIAGTP